MCGLGPRYQVMSPTHPGIMGWIYTKMLENPFRGLIQDLGPVICNDYLMGLRGFWN